MTISSRDTARGKDLGARGTPLARRFAAEQREQGRAAAAGSFADAAAHGEVVINATEGGHSLDALGAARAGDLAGKILIDVANPLDFSGGMPPTLLWSNTDSLAERIQAAFPEARVVKALNTANAQVMVDPGRLPEPTAMFVAGNDQTARDWVRSELLENWLGWRQVLDLGDLTGAARGWRCGSPSG